MADRRPETVTVLFTDVVGSTAWRTRVGDEVADLRTAEFERASRSVVESWGGRVVKSVGDGVMATFDSAVGGLDAAAALQVVARRLAVGGGQHCLRVGISTGDMVREGDDWLGVAAIEASRLCAEAEGGSVLVTDATARLSRGRSRHHLRLAGQRILRGFDAPVEVYEIVLGGDGEVLLPNALRLAGNAPFVGRRAELAHMGRVLDAIVAGDSVVLFVVGEPGVGKSRLAAAVGAEAVARGYTVLYGHCDEGLRAPYQPVVEAFGPWLAECPDAALPRFIGDGADLGQLWPELGSRLELAAGPSVDDPEARRWRMFDAVSELVRSMAHERPVLLVLDDLQWAEPSTLLLLGHLSRMAVPAAALLATVRRAESVSTPANLLGDLGTARSIEIVDLVGFDDAEVAELVALHTGEAPPNDLSARLRMHTDGNPFFLLELLAHLDDVAFVRSPAGRWVTAPELAAAGVPHQVHTVIRRRLSLLEPSARRALDVAAVRGLAFEERVVRDVIGSSVDEAVEAFEAAIDVGLVREVDAGRFAFAHALVRQSVLDDLSRTHVASLHWRIAELLEHHDPTRLGEIAHHYASGRAVGDAATVVRTSLAAGEDALQRVAFEEAAGHLRTALGCLDVMPDDPDLRYRVLAALGGALNALAQPDDARPLWLRAAAISSAARDPNRLFFAILGYGYMMRLTPDGEVFRMLDDLLDLLGPSDSALRASALGWRAVPAQLIVASGPSRDQVRMADDAVEMARRTGDKHALISTLHSRLLLDVQAPDAWAMLRDAEEAVAMIDDSRPTTQDRTFGLRYLTMALLRVGRRAEAEKHLAAAMTKAEQSGLRMSGQNVLQMRSAIMTASGRFSEGKALAAEAAQRGGRHIVTVELGYVAQIVAGRMEQGRLSEVIDALAGLDRLDFDVPGWRAMLAGALAEAGRFAQASDQLDKSGAQFSAGEAESLIEHAPLVIRHLSEVCRRLGQTDRAAEMLAFVRPWAGQMLLSGGLSIEGASDRALGHLLATLGRFDEADAAYTAAAELEQASGFAPLVARTKYWHASALAERDAPGDRRRAHQLLDDTIDLTDRLHMELLGRHAESLRQHAHRRQSR
jgi:class 3 adenylate cyclase/tetratricopeptide (TPR) repeat protein